jgi:hypothetical protein
MRVCVLYRGEPIGTSDLTIHPPFAVGMLEPFATYESLRPVFWEQWRAMLNFGFLPPDGARAGGVDAAGDAAGTAAFARAAEVFRQLELRAEDGSVIAIEDLLITDSHEQSEITVYGFVPGDEDAVAARSPRPPRGESAGSSPAP